jgi:thymidylate kinase
MGIALSKEDEQEQQESILAGLFPRPRPTRIISLDGNIGVGKSTLLETIREHFPEIVIVQEPVDIWTQLKTEEGTNLLELFYKDKKRWAFTFQQAAMLSRLLILQKAIKEAKPGQLILSERSVLTDRHVFASMLHADGTLNALEWSLYMSWYDAFASSLPIAGILYINTGVDTALTRIQSRGRAGELEISKEYLMALDTQHRAWLANTNLPKQEVSTEPGTPIEETLASLQRFFTLH